MLIGSVFSVGVMRKATPSVRYATRYNIYIINFQEIARR